MFNGAVPAMELDGGLTLALLRAVSVAALISAFGALAFQILVMPRTAPHMPPDVATLVARRLTWLARLCMLGALLALAGWLAIEAAAISDAAGVADAFRAIPAVLADTRFGHVVALQAAAVLVGLLALGDGRRETRRRLATAASLAALLLQAGHGHAMAMEGSHSLLVAASLMHLVGAGGWLGGVVPLAMVVGIAPPKAGAVAARWFSPLGKICVALVAGSALVQAWVLVGSVPGFVGTAYGWMALVKLLLFAVLFGFALVNRYRLAPALVRRGPAAKPVLLRSLAAQTAAGLLVVAVAAVLGGLAPAMHTQAIWPFTERFSLNTVREDPDLAREVGGAVLLLAGAAVLPVLALPARRGLRWMALPVAAVLAWLAIPHLDLLLVPAYPTSFYRSPSGFAVQSIMRGAELYPSHCATCHGAEGRGDGPAAAGLPVPPADLTAAHLWAHSDGELFWWVSHGMEAPDGHLVMPGFGDQLSEDDRWALIDYIRAHNAGVTAHEEAGWSPPLLAPELQATCAGGVVRSLADLRGGFVRVVIGGAPAVPGVTTILAAPPPGSRPAEGVCVTDDETVASAYAILAGSGPVADAQFLIDGSGWLRAEQPPGATPGWNDATALAAAIRLLAAHPLARSDGESHAGMAM